MIPFFKKKKSNNKVNSELSEDKESLPEESVQEDLETDDHVETTLSLAESWKDTVSNEQKYVLSFKQSTLPPLKENQLSINGENIRLQSEGIIVNGFIRNTLSQPLQLKQIPLVVKVAGGAIAARKTFDLTEIGELPPQAARPWTFLFENQYIDFKHVHFKEWELAFEIPQQKQEMKLELTPEWEQSLTEQGKQALINTLQKLPKINAGEFNISGVQLQTDEQGNMNVLTFLRNGTEQDVTIHQIPLVLVDATGEDVAIGVFNTEGLMIRSNTCKPWRFVFPKAVIKKENPDLTKWIIKTPDSAKVETKQ